VTDGFYEWKKLDAKGREKQPYAIAMIGDVQMVMAGLSAREFFNGRLEKRT
jgi:putative SOS response-associated peptidase YedK